MLADWIFVRKVALDEALIDEDYGLSLVGIRQLEDSALYERDSHYAELIRADAVVTGVVEILDARLGAAFDLHHVDRATAADREHG